MGFLQNHVCLKNGEKKNNDHWAHHAHNEKCWWQYYALGLLFLIKVKEAGQT